MPFTRVNNFIALAFDIPVLSPLMSQSATPSRPVVSLQALTHHPFAGLCFHQSTLLNANVAAVTPLAQADSDSQHVSSPLKCTSRSVSDALVTAGPGAHGHADLLSAGICYYFSPIGT
jgi:hypothetical protein